MTARRTGISRRNPSEFGTVEVRGERFRALYRLKGEAFRAPKTFETRTAARAWLAEQERAIRGGTWIDPSLGAETLAAYCEDWLTARADLAPTTRAAYRGALDRYILPKLGHLALSAVTPAKVSAWRSECLRDAVARATAPQPTKGNPVRVWALANGHQLAATGRIPAAVRRAWEKAGSPLPGAQKTSRRGDGSAAVAAAYGALRTILGAAERDEVIARSPCRIRGAGAVPAKERTPATPEQVQALAAAMPERYQAAVVLAAWSGLRSGELRGLARRHVDLETKTVRVERGVIEVSGRVPEFGPTKTRGSRRVVALPGFVVEELRRHLDVHVGPKPDALVFGTSSGGILTRTWLGDMFRRAREEVGLPELRFHDLRHTGASLAYAAGASVPDVQRRLGHTTMRAAALYAHSYADADTAVATRMDAIFGEKSDS